MTVAEFLTELTEFWTGLTRLTGLEGRRFEMMQVSSCSLETVRANPDATQLFNGKMLEYHPLSIFQHCAAFLSGYIIFMIGIVDYGIGNLRSVQKAFQHVGGEAVFVRTPDEIAQVDALVLPGVGNFGDCVRSLAKSGMWDAVLAWAQSDRPFFGICVGYQMLFESSEEAPGEKGLGVFSGAVRKFSDQHHLKVPQIGWNTVTLKQTDVPLLNGIATHDFVYFVHSYYVAPKDASIIALETTYGDTFAAAIARDNLIATQFHPEKSQRAGLQLIKNFVALAESVASVPVAK